MLTSPKTSRRPHTRACRSPGQPEDRQASSSLHPSRSTCASRTASA